MTENNKSVYSRKNPLRAKISKKELLTSKIKEKKTWHIEIDLVNSEMEFTPVSYTHLTLPTNREV